MSVEVTPSSISITHSSQSQTRHLILRNASTDKTALIVLAPPEGVPCVKIQKPDRFVTGDTKPPRISLRLPAGDRVVLKILYTPEKKEKLYEHAIVVFSDLNDRPIVVNLTCAPLGTPRVGSASTASVLANIHWPDEIRPATSASTNQLDIESDISEDSEGSEPVSFLESKGWVNDAGESVKSSARRRPPTASNGASKRQLEDNWETLKRSYRPNYLCFVTYRMLRTVRMQSHYD